MRFKFRREIFNNIAYFREVENKLQQKNIGITHVCLEMPRHYISRGLSRKSCQ